MIRYAKEILAKNAKKINDRIKKEVFLLEKVK
jgi:hypothetical protein